jgi:hypothetical protein
MNPFVTPTAEANAFRELVTDLLVGVARVHRADVAELCVGVSMVKVNLLARAAEDTGGNRIVDHRVATPLTPSRLNGACIGIMAEIEDQFLKVRITRHEPIDLLLKAINVL